MTVRTFLTSAWIGTLVSGAALAGVIMWLDPDSAGPLGFILFFCSLFGIVTWGSALLGYGARRWLAIGSLPAYSVRTSLRQGILLASFLTALLLLQLFRVYRWWVAGILIVLVVSVEVVFASYDRAAARRAQFDER